MEQKIIDLGKYFPRGTIGNGLEYCSSIDTPRNNPTRTFEEICAEAEQIQSQFDKKSKGDHKPRYRVSQKTNPNNTRRGRGYLPGII